MEHPTEVSIPGNMDAEEVGERYRGLLWWSGSYPPERGTSIRGPGAQTDASTCSQEERG